MNADPPERRRGRRVLSREERTLWKTVTRSIAPLRVAPAGEVEAEVIVEAAPKAPPKQAAVSRAPPTPQKIVKREPAPPPLASLDRRQKQRIARGGTALDARLDLHGFTQEQAHSALRRFLRNAQGDGARLVLVITGKGARGAYAHEHGERGVLRRLVPQWLRLPEFRAMVIGFEDAHLAHGGEGALYVRIRRTKDGRAE